MKTYATTSYAWIQELHDGEPSVELFMDWLPSVDGSPFSPLAFTHSGDLLLVFCTESMDQADPSGPVPRQISMDAGLLQSVESGMPMFLTVCGPSGALSRRALPHFPLRDGVSFSAGPA